MSGFWLLLTDAAAAGSVTLYTDSFIVVLEEMETLTVVVTELAP